VVSFNRLDESIVLQIVGKEIKAFEEQLREKNVVLEVTEECRKWIARTGYSPEFGARNIARLIQDKVKTYFVDSVLFGDLAGGGKAVVDMDGDEVVIKSDNKKKKSRKSEKSKASAGKASDDEASEEKPPDDTASDEKPPGDAS
jgi:ATP-dependent Clp protease ATP-binding subunit ClpA